MREERRPLLFLPPKILSVLHGLQPPLGTGRVCFPDSRKAAATFFPPPSERFFPSPFFLVPGFERRNINLPMRKLPSESTSSFFSPQGAVL